MGTGDILLLCTDGLTEHSRVCEPYAPLRLEETVRRAKHDPARAIYDAVIEDAFALGPPVEDVSLVVIKRN